MFLNKQEEPKNILREGHDMLIILIDNQFHCKLMIHRSKLCDLLVYLIKHLQLCIVHLLCSAFS